MADIQTAAGAPAHVLEAALRQLVTVIAGEIGNRDLIAAAVLATTEAEKLKAEARKAPRFDLTVNQMLQAIEFATGGFHPDTEAELETYLSFSFGPLQDDDGKITECMHYWLTEMAEEGAIPLDEYPTAQDLAKAQAPAASEQDALQIEAKLSPVAQLSLNTLRWWRELVDTNPGDLAPRIDAAIAAQAAQQGGVA